MDERLAVVENDVKHLTASVEGLRKDLKEGLKEFSVALEEHLTFARGADQGLLLRFQKHESDEEARLANLEKGFNKLSNNGKNILVSKRAVGALFSLGTVLVGIIVGAMDRIIG